MHRPNLTLPLEIKGISERQFDGHGSVFNVSDLGDDIVLSGAFKRSLAQHAKNGTMPPMFWMHNPEKVPGKWLDIREDDYGLAVKGELMPTPLGDEVRILLQKEAVKGMSIGYRTLDHDYDKEGHRLIKEAELWEVSIVSLPMNPLAQIVHVKSQLSERGEYVPTSREFERILRDVGCTQMVAKRIIAKVYEGEQRDVVTSAAMSDSHREGEQAEIQAAEQLAEWLLVSRIKSTLSGRIQP